MKFKLKNNLSENFNSILRRCGYMAIHDRQTQKNSYIRKITSYRYPRFHLYLKETGDEIIFNLHLDQAATVYENQKAHNADYDSQEVKSELARIYSVLKEFLN